MFDTRFESDLENWDLEGQISASHKWDGGHKRIFFLFSALWQCKKRKKKMKTGLNFYWNKLHFCNKNSLFL